MMSVVIYNKKHTFSLKNPQQQSISQHTWDTHPTIHCFSRHENIAHRLYIRENPHPQVDPCPGVPEEAQLSPLRTTITCTAPQLPFDPRPTETLISSFLHTCNRYLPRHRCHSNKGFVTTELNPSRCCASSNLKDASTPSSIEPPSQWPTSR